jgi:hypothetical protein
MGSNNGSECGGKKEVLLKLQAAVNAAIEVGEAEEEYELGQKKDRLCLVIGRAIVDHADELPDGKFKIAEFLDRVVTDIPTRLLLAEQEWL